jgi:hypothetical protein
VLPKAISRSLLLFVARLDHPVVLCLMQTANGAVACQLLDALYPNTVPMKKVLYTHAWHAVRLLGFTCSKLLTAVRACRWTSTQRMSMT